MPLCQFAFSPKLKSQERFFTVLARLYSDQNLWPFKISRFYWRTMCIFRIHSCMFYTASIAHRYNVDVDVFFIVVERFGATLQSHCKFRYCHKMSSVCRLSSLCLSSSMTRVYCNKTAEVKIIHVCSPLSQLFACQVW